VRADLPAEALRNRIDVALEHDVDVRSVGAAEQQVAHRAAHQVRGHLSSSRRDLLDSLERSEELGETLWGDLLGGHR
jgi:hypothetical protein